MTAHLAGSNLPIPPSPLQRRQGDQQTSLTLDLSVIGSNLARNGLASGAEAGQAPSLTSTNNFINFCIGKGLTNGNQVNNGSCNPVPMGDLPNNKKMVGCKFISPSNFQTIKANTRFDLVLNLTNFEAGVFVNPDNNYLAAPQQLSTAGEILGYARFVIEEIESFQDSNVLDPNFFTFFRSANSIQIDGILRTTVAEGIPNGTYRITSMMTAANHQPVLVPVEQHGALHDIIYVAVTDDGTPVPLPSSVVLVPTHASTGPPSTSGGAVPSTKDPSHDPTSSQSSVIGLAVGGALGGFAALALAAGLFLFLCRRNKRVLRNNVFPYIATTSRASIEQYTLEPITHPDPFILPQTVPPSLPTKDANAIVNQTETQRSTDNVPSSSNMASSSNVASSNASSSNEMPLAQSPRSLRSRASKRQSTAFSEAPPPYTEAFRP